MSDVKHTAEYLSAKQTAFAERMAAKKSEARPMDSTKALRRGAVQSAFVLEEVLDATELTTDSEVEGFLENCVPVKTSSGSVRWRLNDSAKSAALQSLIQQPEEIEDALEFVRKIEPTRASMAEGFLQGKLAAVDELSLAELQIASELNSAITTEGHKYDALELSGALNRATLLESFRRVIGGQFVGRGSELGMMEDYVKHGHLETGPEEYRPLLIHGPGGMGKSSLISQFLLTKICDTQPPRMPFAYLDFDRRVLSIEYPGTLLDDVLRQLALFYPDLRSDLQSLRDSWQQRLRTDGSTKKSSKSTFSTARATSNFIRDFSSLIHELGLLRDQPLLLLLDTFEEVQGRSRDYIAEVGRFLSDLDDALGHGSGLRVIISGRIEIAEEHFRTHEHVLDCLDEPASESFLQALGVDAGLTGRIVKQVRGVPLTLRLASKLVLESQDDLLARGDLKSLHPVWDKLRDDQIQGMIYRRYLDQIHDPDVRRLAHPGLVLRRVTPAIIERVLCEPCKIKLTDAATESEHRTKDEIFDALSREVSLVSQDVGRVLKHRPEVRRAMLSLITVDQPEQVKSIHEAAVEFYESIDSPTLSERAEEIYHRLQLNQNEETISGRWMAGVEIELGDCLSELPYESSLVLAARLGQDSALEAVATPGFKGLDQRSWESYAIRKAETSLKMNTPEEALRVLAERSERLPASRLFLLETELQCLAGNWVEMVQTAREGLDSASAAGNMELTNELVLKLVQSLRLNADFDEALDTIAATRRLVPEAEESSALLYHLTLDCGEIEVARLQGSEPLEGTKTKAAERLNHLCTKRYHGAAQVCRRAAGLLEQSSPGVVSEVLSTYGLQTGGMNEPRIRSLAHAFATWEQSISPDQLTLAEFFGTQPKGSGDWFSLDPESEHLLAEAVSSSFSDASELAKFSRKHLKIELHEVAAANSSFDHIIHKYLEHLARRDLLTKFVTRAKKEHPPIAAFSMQINQSPNTAEAVWDAAVRRFATDRINLNARLGQAIARFSPSAETGTAFASYFRIPDESEVLAPLYSQLLLALDDNQLEQVAQRVLGLNVLGRKDKARATLTKAYELGKIEELLAAAAESKATPTVAGHSPEQKAKHIDISAGEGAAWGQLHRALLDAFPSRRDIDELVANLKTDSAPFVSDESTLAEALERIIQDLNGRFELDHLVDTALTLRPQSALLADFAIRRGVRNTIYNSNSEVSTTGSALERMLDSDRGFKSPQEFVQRLAHVSNTVCRISIKDRSIFTGLLVGSNFILTAFHAVKELSEGEASPHDVRVVFDYRTDGKEPATPAEYQLEESDWLYARDEYLDFAIIQVNGTPADDEIGNQERGFLPIAESGPNPRLVYQRHSGAVVLQHPEGGPLNIAMSPEAGIELKDSQIRYRADTKPGSSGAPVLSADVELIGMHLGYHAMSNENFGVPISMIRDSLQSTGHWDGLVQRN